MLWESLIISSSGPLMVWNVWEFLKSFDIRLSDHQRARTPEFWFFSEYWIHSTDASFFQMIRVFQTFRKFVRLLMHGPVWGVYCTNVRLTFYWTGGSSLLTSSVSQSVDLGRSNNPNTTPTKDYKNVQVVVYLHGVQRGYAEEGERSSTPTGWCRRWCRILLWYRSNRWWRG